jgi:hypothetical protein
MHSLLDAPFAGAKARFSFHPSCAPAKAVPLLQSHRSRSLPRQRSRVRPLRCRQRGRFAILQFWPFTNLRPVLFANILIDLHRPITLVKSIGPIASRSRYPILLSCFDIHVIGLEPTSADLPERLATVVDRRARPAESHSPNSSRTVQAIDFGFDVHDPRRKLLSRHGHTQMTSYASTGAAASTRAA